MVGSHNSGRKSLDMVGHGPGGAEKTCSWGGEGTERTAPGTTHFQVEKTSDFNVGGASSMRG